MPLDDDIIEMRGAARTRKELVHERDRTASRIWQRLIAYYPQFLEAVGNDVAAGWVIALWKIAPTPELARRRRITTFAKLLRRHRVTRIGPDELAECLCGPSVECRGASIEEAVGYIRSQLPILELYNAQVRKAERDLEKCIGRAKQEGRLDGENGDGELSDAAILASIPGVGNHVLATLLTEAGQAIERRDCEALRCFTGVAPVTVRSGNRIVVRRRHARNHRLGDALYHWTRVAVQRDQTCRLKYNQARQRGKTHGHALRIVGDRLLKVACAMLRNRTLFRTQQTDAPSDAAPAPKRTRPCNHKADEAPTRPTNAHTHVLATEQNPNGVKPQTTPRNSLIAYTSTETSETEQPVENNP